jgi:hypothetical protein
MTSMGDRPSHIRKAQHNLSLLNNNLPTTGFNDWRVVILFYACLHYVDSRLARLNIHPDVHGGAHGRNRYVSVHLRSVSTKYQTLYNKSRVARYNPDSENHISQQDIDRLINSYLPDFQHL